jgi:hypothetical protein
LAIQGASVDEQITGEWHMSGTPAPEPKRPWFNSANPFESLFQHFTAEIAALEERVASDVAVRDAAARRAALQVGQEASQRAQVNAAQVQQERARQLSGLPARQDRSYDNSSEGRIASRSQADIDAQTRRDAAARTANDATIAKERADEAAAAKPAEPHKG